ncbi:MAG: PAS domain-containing protein [Candidatus Glassbacteria bacterium]|nr:PAS domain-containing protein [Candidatus Glassbacteria bacterium]
MARFSAIRRARWDPLQLSSTQLIKWWMLLRIILVSTTMMVVCFMAALDKSHASSIVIPLVVSLVAVLVSFFFYRAVKTGNPSEIHYYLQYFFDIFLITLITVVSLAADLNFIPLYVMTITVASILSIRPGAYFAATLASLFYLPIGLGVLSLDFTGDRLLMMDYRFTGDRQVLINVGLQVFLFYCLALTTSYLSLRLRRTGWELEDTRKVLKQYKLDTNEILRNIASGLITCNSAGVVVYANPAAFKILGRGPEDLLDHPARELFGQACPEIAGMIERALSTQALAGRRQVEFDRDGQRLPLVVSSSLLLEEGGALSGVSLVFEDVTHEVKARDLALRSGKLEAVAELSAGLAHEIKNPLSSIRSAVELLSETASEPDRSDPQRSRLMDCIIAESDRLTKLLKQFLQFSSGSFGPTEEIELGPIFEEVLNSVENHPEWRREIEVNVSPEVASMRVMGCRDALSQVFFNLMINSAQVRGPDGGKVTRVSVETCLAALQGRALEGVDTGAYHVVCLADDGPGIARELREKVFEPFFSGRKSGFGLGLAVVHRIVHTMGGFVCVDESPWQAKGAAFFIALPRPAPDRQAQAEPAGQGGCRRVARA